MTVYDLSVKVRDLAKDNRHAEALALFKKEKADHEPAQIAANPYLVSSLLTCLRKTGQPHHGLTLLATYGIAINGESPPILLSGYGWTLHALLKSGGDEEGMDAEPDAGDEPEATEAGEEADLPTVGRGELADRTEEWLSLMRTRMEGFDYTVVSNVLKAFLKAETKRPNPDWERVLRVTGLFEPSQLSTECFRVTVERKGRMREMELASDREIWYAARTKALERLGRHEECSALSLEGLEAFEKFHYGNESWFARRLALSLLHMGDREGARKGLEEVLRKKDEWFIRQEIAEMDLADGRTEAALENCRRALAAHGDIEYKVGLLRLTAGILRTLGSKDLSDRHYRLMILLRQSEGWTIGQGMLDETRDMDPAVAGLTDIRSLVAKLRPYWTEGAADKGRRVQGTVSRILNDNEKGVDGFIKAAEVPRAYFIVPRKSPLASAVKVGAAVSFEPVTQPDGRVRAEKVRIQGT